MSRTTTDSIIAHVDLLRAVDRLLVEAEIVRQKRETLNKLVSDTDTTSTDEGSKAEGRSHVS